MNRYVLFLFFFLVTHFTFGNEIKIGVYRSHTIQRIDFAYFNGAYSIVADGTNFGNLSPNEYISIVKIGDRTQLKRGERILGSFKKIVLQALTDDIGLKLRPRDPILKERIYNDGFIISAGTKGLTVVNDVSFKHYLGGVIESEGGGGQHVEYYKAQAVISRTYALKYMNRHHKEGFNLCDQVHCQAYFSKLTHTKAIAVAVEETEGVYIEDTITNKLVDAFFHANCGGQTSVTDYVWKEDIHYLQPIKDTFCIHTRQANWEKKIPKKEWENYLVKEFFYPIEDSLYREFIFTFEQTDRKAFYLSPHLGIPLRDLRYKFNLKSTYFSCYPEGDFVVLKGKGFGHGVGLCQEGAMGMANKGYNYKQILAFYYEGIRFRQYFSEVFFNQETVNEIKF